MCMAIYQSVNRQLTKDQCIKFSKWNNDGFGFAYVDKDKLIVKKTTSFDQFYIQYTIAVNQYGNKSPFLIHFRLGTSGLNNEDNCHPFYVDKNICFIHNGIFREFSHDLSLSDTNIFNKTVLFPIKDTIFTKKTIPINDYNKLVFLNNKKQHVIINEDLGLWKNNIWYSNKYFLD